MFEYTTESTSSLSFNNTNTTAWAIVATKAGYKPVAWSLKWSWSGNIHIGLESVTVEDGKLTLNGLGRHLIGTNNSTITANITWRKL